MPGRLAGRQPDSPAPKAPAGYQDEPAGLEGAAAERTHAPSRLRRSLRYIDPILNRPVNWAKEPFVTRLPNGRLVALPFVGNVKHCFLRFGNLILGGKGEVENEPRALTEISVSQPGKAVYIDIAIPTVFSGLARCRPLPLLLSRQSNSLTTSDFHVRSQDAVPPIRMWTALVPLAQQSYQRLDCALRVCHFFSAFHGIAYTVEVFLSGRCQGACHGVSSDLGD